MNQKDLNRDAMELRASLQAHLNSTIIDLAGQNPAPRKRIKRLEQLNRLSRIRSVSLAIEDAIAAGLHKGRSRDA